MQTLTDDFLGHELEEWLPMEPTLGPPLPKFLGIYWPWYKPVAPPPPPPPGLANLYGVVTDSQTGKPLAGVLVSLDGMTTYTDDGGNYTFTDLDPRAYVLQFSKEGYQAAVY